MLTHTHRHTHKLSWLPDEISTVLSLSSQLQGPITTLQACQLLLTAIRCWKWKGRMGGEVLEISSGRGPFYNSYWNTLNALAVRCRRSFSSWACWCSMTKWSILHLLNFMFSYKERVKYSHRALSCSLRYPSLHSSTSVPACFTLRVFCEVWAVQNGKIKKEWLRSY